MGFIHGLGTNAVFMIFLTLVCGYAFGRINFAGVKFGTSGVLVMALIFGALGMEVPAIIGTAGALGDAGSPASDSTLGPTMGFNADGQHNHVKDSVIPTFIHYNIPLLLAGWVAALVL